jgi:acetylornithine deacetylase/succinyl-diaminopimelate desuccinylase-like protein
LVEARPDLCPDFVVGEGAGERIPTPEGPVYLLDHGVKATASATLTVLGIPGDASLPDAGASAVFQLARLLRRLEEYRSPERVPDQLRPLLDVVAPGSDGVEERLRRARQAHPALDRILGGLTGTVIHPTIVEAAPPQNQVSDRAQATLACIVLPGTTAGELEAELRAALGEGSYQLEVTEPKGGLLSDTGTDLHRAIEDFLSERDPGATLVPALGYGFSDCHVLREAYGSVAYGFIPFRHADPMTNLTTKHGVDERVLVEDLVFQLDAALHIARSMGGRGATRCPQEAGRTA